MPRAVRRIGQQFKKRQVKISEKQIETQILHYLKHKNVFCWKVENGGVYDVRRSCYRFNHATRMLGISDICGIVFGRFLAIEVKSQKGRLSLHQDTFLKEVQARGGIAFVARSVEDVIANLKLSEK